MKKKTGKKIADLIAPKLGKLRKGLVIDPKPTEGVVIIGGGARLDADLTLKIRSGWQVWCLNAIRPHWLRAADITACFNLHRYEHLRRDWRSGIYAEAEFASREEARGIPFYVVDPWPKELIPYQVIFPREQVAKSFPRPDYHASSIDWMVAFAIHHGLTDIAIRGITFMDEIGEPISARPCLEYWIGLAEGRGAKVHIGNDCPALMKQFHYMRSESVYGWDDVQMIEDRVEK